MSSSSSPCLTNGAVSRLSPVFSTTTTKERKKKERSRCSRNYRWCVASLPSSKVGTSRLSCCQTSAAALHTSHLPLPFSLPVVKDSTHTAACLTCTAPLHATRRPPAVTLPHPSSRERLLLCSDSYEGSSQTSMMIVPGSKYRA